MADGNSNSEGNKITASQDFDFEKMLKILTSIFLSIGLVIYSFCLGYFHRLEIPDYPSLVGAIRFYLTSVLKNLISTPTSIVELIAIFILFYLIIRFYFKRSDGFWQKVVLTFSIIVSISIFYLHRLSWLFAPPLACLVSGLKLFDQTVDNRVGAGDKSRSLLIHVFFVVFCCFWAFAALDMNYLTAKPISSKYPVGFGIVSYEPSNLIWVDGDRRYWANCQQIRGVIYGTYQDEKIFSRTEMSSDLYQSLCIPFK